MFKKTTMLCLLAIGLATSFVWAQQPQGYPQTQRSGHTDTYHGKQVADPYRWLEDDVRESDDVADWVERQNEVTFGYLKQIPQRDRIESRLTELWNYEKYGTPSKKGDRYFYSKNDGLQNQSVLYTMKSLDDEPQVLIDPNSWSEDGTIALSGMAVSDDAKYLAYGVQDAGSDWKRWRVMEIDSRKVLDDELQWVKFSGASWNKDGTGFYYSRFDEPKKAMPSNR